MQREHADLVILAAIADHLAATREEYEIGGAVPLLDHVQPLVDLAAQFLRVQIPAQENRLDGFAPFQRRVTAIPPELIGRIAPTHIEGINLRGVYRFPVEEYAEQLLPSSLREKTAQWSGKLHSFRRKMHGQKRIRNSLYYSRVQTLILELKAISTATFGSKMGGTPLRGLEVLSLNPAI